MHFMAALALDCPTLVLRDFIAVDVANMPFAVDKYTVWLFLLLQ